MLSVRRRAQFGLSAFCLVLSLTLAVLFHGSREASGRPATVARAKVKATPNAAVTHATPIKVAQLGK